MLTREMWLVCFEWLIELNYRKKEPEGELKHLCDEFEFAAGMLRGLLAK